MKMVRKLEPTAILKNKKKHAKEEKEKEAREERKWEMIKKELEAELRRRFDTQEVKER